MQAKDQALLAALSDLAREAGEAIMEVYRQDFAVRRKADASPVTEADVAAERIIVAGLERLAPGIPIVAEEAVSGGAIPDISDGSFWLVDPLDGTKEFVSRNGEFTVNIALIRDRAPALGVVLAPALDLLFAGAGPGTATRRRDGGPAEPIAARAPAPDGVVVVASRSHLSPETEAWLKTVNVKRFVQAGSSLKFCRVAAGEADLYPRHGRTMEWDTAAGHAVLTAAGGSVTTFDGRPLTYAKPGFENPYFLARGRGQL